MASMLSMYDCPHLTGYVSSQHLLVRNIDHALHQELSVDLQFPA